MAPQPAPRASLPAGTIIGFFLLAAALYWLAVVVGILGESPKATALSFLLVFLALAVGRFGWI